MVNTQFKVPIKSVEGKNNRKINQEYKQAINRIKNTFRFTKNIKKPQLPW